MSDCHNCEKTDQMDQGQHEAEIHRVSVQLKNGTPEIRVRTYNTVLMHDNTGNQQSRDQDKNKDFPRVHSPIKDNLRRVEQKKSKSGESQGLMDNDEKEPCLNESI
ncbi:unnamed protein product [Caenorhabditis brenneri]